MLLVLTDIECSSSKVLHLVAAVCSFLVCRVGILGGTLSVLIAHFETLLGVLLILVPIIEVTLSVCKVLTVPVPTLINILCHQQTSLNWLTAPFHG